MFKNGSEARIYNKGSKKWSCQECNGAVVTAEAHKDLSPTNVKLAHRTDTEFH